jgi:hypothetical protein
MTSAPCERSSNPTLRFDLAHGRRGGQVGVVDGGIGGQPSHQQRSHPFMSRPQVKRPEIDDLLRRSGIGDAGGGYGQADAGISATGGDDLPDRGLADMRRIGKHAFQPGAPGLGRTIGKAFGQQCHRSVGFARMDRPQFQVSPRNIA